MIESLRKKFILISMCSIFAVLAVISICINTFNYIQINKKGEELLHVIAQNNGKFPKMDKNKEIHNKKPFALSPETPFNTRFFTVTMDFEYNIITVDTGKIAATTPKGAAEYAEKVLELGRKTGFQGIYKYIVVSKEYGSMIIFIDFSKELETFQSFLKNSILISIAGLISVFILVLFFSKKAIKPVVESYEKQKQFITNAGHELKTPLAIISANTEVLEMDFGENQWTKSITNQVNRMTDLTASLVTLARMEENAIKVQMTDFSMSDAVLESADPFVSLAKTKEKEIQLEIEKNISYYGDEKLIRQLVSILLDNGVKYSIPNHTIKVELEKHGKCIKLVVCNQTAYLDKNNLNGLFERFYRGDTSRNSSTSGYGIGLSIAKAIVSLHKGKIKIESQDGSSIVITVQFYK